LIEQLAESNGIDSVHKISEAVSEVLGTVDSALARVDAATGDRTNLSGGAKALKIALESPLLFYEPVSTAWFMNTGLLTIPKTLFVGDGNTIEFKEDGCMDIENFWGHYGIHTVLDAESEYVWTNHDPSNQDPLGDALQSPALAQAMNFLSFQFFQMFLPDRTVDPQVDCAPAIAAMMDKDKTNTDPFQNYAAAGLDIHAMPGKWGYRNAINKFVAKKESDGNSVVTRTEGWPEESLCDDASQCQSGTCRCNPLDPFCQAGLDHLPGVRSFCVPCTTVFDDSGCPEGQYCKAKIDRPLHCTEKFDYGKFCRSDGQCHSSKCDVGDFTNGLRVETRTCIDCTNDGHCAENQFCFAKKCFDKKKDGEGCLVTLQCESGWCNNNIPQKCEGKKNNEEGCGHDNLCKSGNCKMSWQKRNRGMKCA